MSKKILIVEDNVLNLKLTKKLISMAGLHALTAYNAEDGIRIARTEKPDLILMDIQLPGINGLDATRIIKNDKDMSSIPIVALSAHAMQEEMNKAREAGCNGYITKPLDTRTFLKTLHGFLFSEIDKNEEGTEKSGESVQAPRILLADADPENRKLVKSFLSGLGAEIINAAGENGISASLNVFTDSIDLLIVGFVSPEARRFETAEAFRADSATAEIPILAITNGPSEIEKAWNAGADAIIGMPLSQTELIEKVCRLLNFKKGLASCSENGCSIFSKEISVTQPVIVFIGLDEKNVEKIMNSLVDDKKYRALMFSETKEALEYIKSGRTDVICYPAVLQDYNPVSLCSAVKSQESTSSIQILMLSKNMGTEKRIQAINAGCDDYVDMPVPINELSARIKALVKKKSTLDALNSKVESAMNSSITDRQTGLYTYSYFRHYLDIEVRRSIRQGYSIAVMIIEMNDFGKYTEIHGNQTAENAIKEASGIITACIRAVDFPARFSVNKFAVIFPYTDNNEVMIVAERIKKNLCECFGSVDAWHEEIFFSSGLAICPEEAIDCVSLIHRANSKLIESRSEAV